MIKIIKIFGDIYKIRKTYDIDDFGIGCYGFDVYDENDDFLCHFVGDDKNELKQYIKMRFYKIYESTHSYNK
jgi:hypothetical protein